MANILNPDDPGFGGQFGGIGGQGTAPWSAGPSGTPGDKRPPPSPAAPGYPPSINVGTNFTPNYPAIIRSDPGYIAATNAAKAAEATAAASRREAIRQQYIQYGGDLAGWTDKYGDIDQATRDLASKNQYSQLSQLARQLALNTRQTRQQLAARGMLQSGELSYGLDQLNTGFGQSRYDAGVALGNQFGQDINTYTGVLGQNARDMAAATQAAAANAYQNPANRPTHAISAGYDAGASAKAAQPVYKYVNPDSGDVTYYTQRGEVYSGA